MKILPTINNFILLCYIYFGIPISCSEFASIHIVEFKNSIDKVQGFSKLCKITRITVVEIIIVIVGIGFFFLHEI